MTSIEEQYQKKSQKEHILLRPDTYIGSVEGNLEKLWIYDKDNNKFEFKEINNISGLYKLVDEILVNAADASNEDNTVTQIKVEISKDEISIENNGKGIPVVLHKEEKLYVPKIKTS